MRTRIEAMFDGALSNTRWAATAAPTVSPGPVNVITARSSKLLSSVPPKFAHVSASTRR